MLVRMALRPISKTRSLWRLPFPNARFPRSHLRQGFGFGRAARGEGPDRDLAAAQASTVGRRPRRLFGRGPGRHPSRPRRGDPCARLAALRLRLRLPCSWRHQHHEYHARVGRRKDARIRSADGGRRVPARSSPALIVETVALALAGGLVGSSLGIAASLGVGCPHNRRAPKRDLLEIRDLCLQRLRLERFLQDALFGLLNCSVLFMYSGARLGQKPLRGF